MKKVLSVIFAAALVASMFVVGAISASAADEATYYFQAPSSEVTDKAEYDTWGTTVCHYWYDESAGLTGTTWPGEECKLVEGTTDIYSITISDSSKLAGIIFNDGSYQTQNIGGGVTLKNGQEVAKCPEIQANGLYTVDGTTVESDDNGKTVMVTSVQEYQNAATESSEESSEESSKDDTSSTDTTSTDKTTSTTSTETSDTTTVATGDTSAAWVLLAVVAASLGTAVVMTKKASSKD